MALGEAYVGVKADTTKFAADLQKQLKAILKELPDLRVRVTADVTAATRAVQASSREQARAVRAASAEATAAVNRAAREQAAISRDAGRQVVAAARATANAERALQDEIAATARAASAAIARARREAYAANAAAARAAAEAEVQAQRLVLAAAREAAAQQAALGSGLTNFANAGQSAVLGVGGAITKGIVYPLLAVGAAAVGAAAAIGFFGLKSTATIQSVKIAFEGIIAAQEQYAGDLKAGTAAGDVFFQQLQQFAKLTPFRFQDLGKAAQQLLAIGLKGPQVLGVLTDVGNSLALTGDLSADRLNNVILAMTQINSLGHVTRDNIRQITSNMPTFNQKIFVEQIALLEAIKARGAGATASTADLATAQHQLENGLVPSNVGMQALVNTMKATPGAAGAMDRAMTTLTGVLSNFKDAAQISLTNAFLPQLPGIQKALEDFTPILASAFGEIAPAIGRAITAIGPFLSTIVPAFVNVMEPVVAIFQNLLDVAGPVLAGVFNALAPVFQALLVPLVEVARAISEALLPVLPQLTASLVEIVPPLAELALALVPLVPLFVQLVSAGIGVLAAILPTVTPLIQAMVGALSAILSIPGASTFFGALAVGIGALFLVAKPLVAVFTAINILLPILGAQALTAGEAIGLAFEIALGPVGLVILAITALTVGFIEAWQHSETFRDIVVPVFNVVKDVIVTIGQALYDFLIFPLKVALIAIKGVASLGAKLGIPLAKSVKDAANSALDDIDAIGSGIGSLRGKDINVNIGIHTRVIGPSPADLAKLLGGTIDDPDGAFASAAAVAASAAIGGKPATSDDISSLSGVGGGGGGAAGGGAAASKAKAAAKKIKDAFNQLSSDLKKIGDQTSKQSASTIKSEFDALVKDLIDSGHKALTKAARDTEKQLLKLAQQRDILDEISKSAHSAADSLHDTIEALGSVAQGTAGIGTTFTGIQNQLRFALSQTNQFNAVISQLKAARLNATSLNELIKAGPAGLANAQAILGGGAAGITGAGGINELQAKLDAAAGTAADAAYNQFYKTGVSAADGLVAGMTTDLEKVTKAMDKLGDKMIAALKKRLGIKSPSTAFEDLTANVPLGAARGIENNLVPLQRAMNTMSSAMTNNFNPGSIVVNSANPNNPEGTGVMLGHGIVNILERQRTQSALMGFGG